MTPALYASLAPHLLVYPDGAPDADAADPVVRRALDWPAPVSVEVQLQATDGAVARLSAVVRLNRNDPAPRRHPGRFASGREPV